MNDDSVDAMRYYVELKLLDDKKKFKRNKTILKILYDVLIILSFTWFILVVPTEKLWEILLSYVVLAIGYMRRLLLD